MNFSEAELQQLIESTAQQAGVGGEHVELSYSRVLSDDAGWYWSAVIHLGKLWRKNGHSTRATGSGATPQEAAVDALKSAAGFRRLVAEDKERARRRRQPKAVRP